MSSDTPTTPLLDYANPVADQPIGSRALCERHAEGGVTYTLPPEGIVRALPSLIVLGVPVVGLLVAMVAIALSYRSGVVFVCAMPAFLPLAALWAGLLRAALRPTVISIRDGTVTLFSGAALFSPVKRWPAAEVAEVRVSFSGMSARVRLVGDLRLRMLGGPTAPLIHGGDKAELEWIARGLREALRLPPVA